MQFQAIVSDYDGTLAEEGRVSDATLAALERLKRSGRKTLLVTGRELEELLGVFPEVGVFDRVVAENGALLYEPGSGRVKLLGDPPPPLFVESLKRRGVGPISVGRAIVATWEPHEPAVRETIRELGLRLHIILNKRAVMVLPEGVDKASGMLAALDELGLAAANAVGVGDAENDLAFLVLCGRAVAVANALPALQQRCDWTTTAPRGAGVSELIDRLLLEP